MEGLRQRRVLPGDLPNVSALWALPAYNAVGIDMKSGHGAERAHESSRGAALFYTLHQTGSSQNPSTPLRRGVGRFQ